MDILSAEKTVDEMLAEIEAGPHTASPASSMAETHQKTAAEMLAEIEAEDAPQVQQQQQKTATAGGKTAAEMLAEMEAEDSQQAATPATTSATTATASTHTSSSGKSAAEMLAEMEAEDASISQAQDSKAKPVEGQCIRRGVTIIIRVLTSFLFRSQIQDTQAESVGARCGWDSDGRQESEEESVGLRDRKGVCSTCCRSCLTELES